VTSPATPKKVVLLAINAKYVHSALAVWLLADGIKKYACLPHQVEIIEATINQTIDEIAGQVIAYNPDVVGISTYIWNADKLPALIKHLKEQLPNAIFILGGPEASHNQDYWLANGADYVVKGEGERKLPVLLDELAKGLLELTKPPKGKLNPCRDANNKPATISANATNNESLAPHTNAPINVSLAPHANASHNEAYINSLKGKLAYLQTSKGCPNTCAFCLSGDEKLSFLPIEAAKAQLYQLSKSQAKTIKLVDRTFNCNPTRAYELFEYVIGLETNHCFHFEIAADLLNQQSLDLLRTAPPGRIQFEAGIQSYHEPTLAAISRKANQSKVDENLKSLLKAGNIHIHIDLIAGLPHETLEIFKDSFDRAYKLGAHNLQLGFLKLLHGSALRNQAANLGIQYNQAPPYEIIQSPWLSPDDISQLKQTENALRQTYNKGRFMSTLEYVLTHTAETSEMRPYDLFHKLGQHTPNHGLSLEIYAEEIFKCFSRIHKIDTNQLLTHMITDWLSMVRGKNMPAFMRLSDTQRKQIIPKVEKILGRPIGREEVAKLPSGDWVYVDVQSRDPVTGLYKIFWYPVI